MSVLSLKQCNEILVAGCGLMGAGITQVVAQAGYKVTVVDRTDHDLSRGQRQIEKGLSKLEAKEQKNIMNNIQFSRHLEDGKNADLAIEAIPEKIGLKIDLFKTLESDIET